MREPPLGVAWLLNSWAVHFLPPSQWLRYSRPTALARRCRAPALRERRSNGSRIVRHHLDVWWAWCPLQPGGLVLVDATFDGLAWRDAAAYLPAQVAGCVGGAVVANLMFSKAAISISTKHRASGPHFRTAGGHIGVAAGDLCPRCSGRSSKRSSRRRVLTS